MKIEEQEEIVDNSEVLDEDEGGENGSEDGETTFEEWQLDGTEDEEGSEDAEDEDGEKPKPEKSLKAKKKLQRKLKEADDEKDALKAEIEQLKKSNAAPAAKPTGRPVRPKEDDYDSDEEYETAMDQWGDDISDWRQSERTSKKAATETHDKQAAQIKERVNSHFERAETLVETTDVSTEKYNASNKSIRAAIDAISPGKGDFITDYFISKLGNGSEKVFYQLGINKKVQAEFITLLTENPNGDQALIYLGQKKEQLTNPKKRKTNAPAPASNVKGDATGGKAGGVMKRAYDKAEKTGSAQAMYNAKKEAKIAGVDVSKW